MYQLLSLHGQNKDALKKSQLGAWEYDIIGPWYKFNMTDIMAAIGLRQMDRYAGLLKRRKEIDELIDFLTKVQDRDTFPELGMEALHLIKVDKYPAIIGAAHGKSIYTQEEHSK